MTLLARGYSHTMSATTPGAGQGSASGVAAAVTQLTEQTTGLVQQEITAARREVVGKLTANLPAAAMLGVAGLMSVFALASSYRWVLALLEKRLPPASAAFVALLLDGAAAGTAGALGAKWLKAAPAPVPSETAQHVGDIAVDVREGVQRGTTGA
jgi:Putative Actinobacterial Holin-X, holin superfamily III